MRRRDWVLFVVVGGPLSAILVALVGVAAWETFSPCRNVSTCQLNAVLAVEAAAGRNGDESYANARDRGLRVLTPECGSPMR